MVGVWRLSRPVRKDSYEAVVVGSGFGGAVVPAALPRPGSPWPFSNAGVASSPGASRDQHEVVSTGCSGTRAARIDVKALKDILVVQAAGYGGGSLIYAKTRLMEEAATRLGRGAQLFRPNIAVRFKGLVNRQRRTGSVPCSRAVSTAASATSAATSEPKNTLDLNYLAFAESMGADVGTDCEVKRIAPSEAGFELHFRDRKRR
jgi:cholesterol oxidase